ncbi:SGNH/GDSL hydrolase family protein, partial [Streptomyces sp. ActVer]|nr:SGNH/GDSL hydrolase family protein [Streptomyces sp. ActVer]
GAGVGRRLRGESSGDRVVAKGSLSPDDIKMRIEPVA